MTMDLSCSQLNPQMTSQETNWLRNWLVVFSHSCRECRSVNHSMQNSQCLSFLPQVGLQLQESILPYLSPTIELTWLADKTMIPTVRWPNYASRRIWMTSTQIGEMLTFNRWKRSWVDAVTPQLSQKVKFIVSEEATCTTARDRCENASTRWWCSILLPTKSISSRLKELVCSHVKITVAQSLEIPWLFLEDNIKMDRSQMICLTLILSIMIGHAWILNKI